MPWSVRIAVLALAMAAAIQAGLVIGYGLAVDIGWLKGLFASALFAVLLVGLTRASRLAWLWGRYLGFLLSGGVVIGLALQARLGGLMVLPAVLLGAGVALPLAAHSLALGHRSAYEWFGLVCPSCGATTGRGDLLMWSARCGKCGAAF